MSLSNPLNPGFFFFQNPVPWTFLEKSAKNQLIIDITSTLNIKDIRKKFKEKLYLLLNNKLPDLLSEHN